MFGMGLRWEFDMDLCLGLCFVKVFEVGVADGLLQLGILGEHFEYKSRGI